MIHHANGDRKKLRENAEHITPRALANCSPGFPTLGLHEDERT